MSFCDPDRRGGTACSEYKQNKEAQKKYLDFLRAWLKDKDYVALAYMTGILPIKKYGSIPH